MKKTLKILRLFLTFALVASGNPFVFADVCCTPQACPAGSACSTSQACASAGGTATASPCGLGGNTFCCDMSGPVCGDGVREGNEECDDGNTLNGDDCTSTCQSEPCAQGVCMSSQTCVTDGGVNVGSCGFDLSLTCCDIPLCGDGDWEGNEQCDDGNQVDFDACTNDCLTNMCPADYTCGVVLDCASQGQQADCLQNVGCSPCCKCVDPPWQACPAGSTCNVAPNGAGGGCSSVQDLCSGIGFSQSVVGTCGNTTQPSCAGQCIQCVGCGNDVLDAGEQCDGANNACSGVGQTCDSNCQCVNLCGNGVLDPGEQCDGVNRVCAAGSTCDGNCQCIPDDPGQCPPDPGWIDPNGSGADPGCGILIG